MLQAWGLERLGSRLHLPLLVVSRSQTVWEGGGGGGGTVWTTDVERFVLTPTGTGVGDKWVPSVCGAHTSIAAAHESH